MNLSFRIVADLNGLHDLTHPYEDLSRLFQMSDHEHPPVTSVFLERFFKQPGTLAIACEQGRIIGKAVMVAQIKQGKICARIDGFVVSPPRRGIVGHLMTVLIAYAKPSVSEIDIIRNPGIYRRVRIN